MGSSRGRYHVKHDSHVFILDRRWGRTIIQLVGSIDFHCRNPFRLRHDCPAIHTRPRFSSSRLCRRTIVGRSNNPSLLAMGSCSFSFTTGWERYTKTREMGKRKENFVVRKEIYFPNRPTMHFNFRNLFLLQVASWRLPKASGGMISMVSHGGKRVLLAVFC